MFSEIVTTKGEPEDGVTVITVGPTLPLPTEELTPPSYPGPPETNEGVGDDDAPTVTVRMLAVMEARPVVSEATTGETVSGGV